MAYIVPTVLERTRSGEVSYDLYSRLLRDRIVFVHGGVDTDMANIVVAQLLYLEKESTKEDIHMYINSHGGSIMDGMAIHDTMKHIKCDVSTIVVGMALSMGAFLLASGTKGKRFALPNSTVLIHQPMLTLEDTFQVTELEIQAEHSKRVKANLLDNFSKYTGQSKDKLKNDMERDYWLDATQAKEYGIIDKVLKSS